MYPDKVTTDLLATIGGLLGGLTLAAGAVAKVVRYWNTGRQARSASQQDWAIEGFKANIAALTEENTRCWAENARIRKDCEDKQKEIEELEERLKVRKDEVHKLNNTLQVTQMMLHEYQTKFGRIDFGPELNDKLDDSGEIR